MAFLLDFTYVMLGVLSAPYLAYKLLTRPKYRAGLRERLGKVEPRPSTKPCIWVHGVSVGEILAGKSFIASLKETFPEWEVVISTTTNTGYQVARKNFPEKRVIYYPLDLGLVVRRVVKAIRPSIIVLVELEIWPNFLDFAYREGIPVILVNGRITERSCKGYQIVRRLLFQPLRRIRRFSVQNEEYAERFRRLGVPAEQIRITGSMKYDNIFTGDVEELRREVLRNFGISAEEKILIGGSTHHPEERILIQIYQEIREEFPDLRLILVPRHIERIPDIEGLLSSFGQDYILRTELRGKTELAGGPEGKVILVNTIGELRKIYAAGTVVFVGGSLIPHGGQNMLEPAGIGKPVIFGPHVFNFRESSELLLRNKAALRVSGGAELKEKIRLLLRDQGIIRDLGERARKVIEQNKGATVRTLEILKEVARENALQKV